MIFKYKVDLGSFDYCIRYNTFSSYSEFGDISYSKIVSLDALIVIKLNEKDKM